MMTSCVKKYSYLGNEMLQPCAQPAVLLADFRNWFYQIPLPLAWRKWFRARVVCGRGAFFDVELFVLSMGFALSVFIAHSLALAVARRAAETTAVDHDAWVDNLVWAGPPANLRRTAAELERLRGSAAPALHEDTFEFLGLEFSLRKKVVVPSAALRGKIAAGCADIVAQPSLRPALSVIGLLCWVNWAVARCPLAFAPALLSWLRAACRDLSALDVVVPLPPAVVEDVLRLAEITSSSRFRWQISPARWRRTGRFFPTPPAPRSPRCAGRAGRSTFARGPPPAR
jgi:hypothetical protein